MNGSYINKVIVVTGAARGIGKVIAHRFAEEGGRVVIVDINQAMGKKTVAEFRNEGLDVFYLPANLSRVSEIQRAMKQVKKKFKRLDVLVNNARSGKRTQLLSETERTWDEALSVTLKGAFFASQEAIRIMSSSQQGAIMNVCSIAAFMATPESPSYHAAKAGLLQLTRYLAAEAGRYGVRVNAVVPGFIVQNEHMARFNSVGNKAYRTSSLKSHPIGKIGTSSDVAAAVSYLCSDEARFVTGQGLVLDGGLTVQEQSYLIRRGIK